MITVVLGILAIVAWLALEVTVRRPGEASSLAGSADDRRTTPVLVAAYAIAGALPLLLGTTGIGSIGDAAWIGVALAAVGLLVRAWAMRTLGTAYSRRLRVGADQILVTAGPYRWVRHPGYAGSLAIWVGAALAFHSWLAAVVAAVLMAVAYGWRIRSEEAMLGRQFGAAYQAYAARTARLLPGIY